MTNKITVPSELIHRAIDAIEQVGYQDKFIDYTFVRAVKQELRDALDEPTRGIDHETMRARYTDPEALDLSSGTGSTLRFVVADPVPPAGDWGIDTTAGRPILVYQGCSVIEAEQAYYVLGLINGTVPPAGGEPEVRAAFDAWFIHDRALDPQTDTTLIDGPFEPWRAWKACADQYSAHVTQLKAEVERLKERDLGVELEVFEIVCKERDALQSELAKARELLSTHCPNISIGVREFLSNQSAPADKGRGETVHECQKCWGRGAVPTRLSGEGETEYRNRCKAYAEQPAPVAAVMPERKTVKAGLLSESNTHNQGWNACLDEFARLNSEPKP